MKRDLRRWRSVFIRAVWLCLISCFFLSAHPEILAAQQSDPTLESQIVTRDEKVQSQPWEPSPPAYDKFDWIQTTSGEWLKGELKVLYKDKVEFDSDEFDLQELDWEDVKYFRGHRIFSVRFEGAIYVEGLLEVTEDKVYVTVGEDRQEFDRSKLVAIAPGEKKEIRYWSAKAGFGLTFTRGNTEQDQYNGSANIQRRTSRTRYILDYVGIFTKTEDITTINNHKVNTFFDIQQRRRLFWRVVFLEYFRDPIANIAHRGTVGTGVGYIIIDTSKTEWDVTVGPAFQQTWFDSTEAGQNSTESTPALVVGTHFDIELTKRLDFDFLYNFQIVNEVSGRYTHRMVPAFEIEITDWLDLDLSLIWQRIENPQADADGVVPKQDDLFYLITLEVDF